MERVYTTRQQQDEVEEEETYEKGDALDNAKSLLGQEHGSGMCCCIMAAQRSIPRFDRERKRERMRTAKPGNLPRHYKITARLCFGCLFCLSQQ